MRHLLAFLALLSIVTTALGQAQAEQDRLEFFTLNPPELPDWLAEATSKLDTPVTPAAEVTALMAQLGADRAAQRKAAGEALVAIGLPALPELLQAESEDDPEVRERAAGLTARIRQNSANALFLRHVVRSIRYGIPIPKPDRGDDTSYISRADTLKLQMANCTDELTEPLFALRRYLPTNELIEMLDGLNGKKSAEAAQWLRLIGQIDGTPIAFCGSRPGDQLNKAKIAELNPPQLAWLARAIASEDRFTRHAAATWQLARGIADQGSAPLEAAWRGDDLLLQDVAAVFLLHTDEGKMRSIAEAYMAESNAVPTRLRGIDLYGLWLYKTRDKTYQLKIEREDLKPLEAMLSNSNASLRLAAAYSMIPPRFYYHTAPNSQSSADFDRILFSGERLKPDGLEVMIQRLNGEEIDMPEEWMDFCKNTTVDGLKAFHPAALVVALRILIDDYQALPRSERPNMHSLLRLRMPYTTPTKGGPELIERWLHTYHLTSSSQRFSSLSELKPDQQPPVLHELIRHGPYVDRSSYLRAVQFLDKDHPHIDAILQQARQGLSVERALQASLALAHRGQTESQDLARQALGMTVLPAKIRALAANVLATQGDTASQPARQALFDELVASGTNNNYQTALAISQALWALRDQPNDSVKDYLRSRLATGQCGNEELHAAKKYCYNCVYLRNVAAILALRWQLDFEKPSADYDAKNSATILFHQVHWLLNKSEPKVPVRRLYTSLRAPDGLDIDLVKDNALRLDQMLDTTLFAPTVGDTPDAFSEAWRTWRESDEAIPFLPPKPDAEAK